MVGIGVTLGAGGTVYLDDGEWTGTGKSESDVVLYTACSAVTSGPLNRRMRMAADWRELQN